MIFSFISRNIFVISFGSAPNIGLPSDLILKSFDKKSFIFSTDLISGAK